jgi:hypothetical protein
MSRLEMAGRLGELSNFGQALIAVRMVRRAVLAKYATDDTEGKQILRGCDIAEECCSDGNNVHRHKPVLKLLMELRDLPGGMKRGSKEWVRHAVWLMADSVLAADASQDFAMDGTALRSAQAAIASLLKDPELNGLQISILLSSDIDLQLFACEEIGKLPAKNLAAKYEGVGTHVMSRLTPVFALTVTPYEPTGEKAAR